jgi:hypothetical protein
MTQTILLLIGLTSVFLISVAFYWNNWIAKFAVLAFCVLMANSIYFSLDGVKGWPAEEPREVKGTLASVVILNPSEKTEGAIYISVYLKDPPKWYEYDYPRIAPKTFYVRYSNSRAAQFEKAKKAMQEGQEIRINGIPPMEGQGEGEEYNGDPSDITTMFSEMFAKLMSKQKDTYQPKVPPDLEIVERSAPPEKEKTE